MDNVEHAGGMEEQFIAALMDKVIEEVSARSPDCRVLVDCGDGSGLDFRFGGEFPLDHPGPKLVFSFDLS